MKKNNWLNRFKLASIHIIHGFFPFLFEKAIHSIDDGDPTTRQTRILNRHCEGYLNHLLLNFFLAKNHLKGDLATDKHGQTRTEKNKGKKK